MTLHSGLITQAILAAYDYEGGELNYVVTYGDKSMTQIEPGAEENIIGKTQQTEAAPAADVWLYVGIGAVALAAIAGAILFLKKKKPAETK